MFTLFEWSEEFEICVLPALALHVLFVTAENGQPIGTDGHAFLEAEVFPYRVGGQVFKFLRQCQASGEIAVCFGLLQQSARLQQGGQHGFPGGTQPDHPGRHAVDALSLIHI